MGAQTMPQVLRMMKAIFSGVQCDGGDDEVALVLAIVVVGDDDDLAAGEGFDGGGDGMDMVRSSGGRPTGPAGMKSLGVTAPPVSRQISSAMSRDIQAESLLQSCVIAAGDMPMRRANSMRR